MGLRILVVGEDGLYESGTGRFIDDEMSSVRKAI